MNNEILEEKENNKNKVLIAIIIILLLALGGLSYYTFFVRDKIIEERQQKQEKPKADETIETVESNDYKLKTEFGYKTINEIDKSIETIPYKSLMNNKSNTYEEMIAYEILSSAYLKLDSVYKKDGPAWDYYRKYMNSNIVDELPYKIFLKECNFSTSEIEKADGILWGKILGTTGGYVIIDANKIDSIIRSIYGESIKLFSNSFLSGSFVYDKNINKLIKTLPSALSPTEDLNAVYIIDRNNANNKYEITFINEMFRQYSGDSRAMLLINYENTTETSYSLDELTNNKELVNKILMENEDKIPHYKITFKLVDGYYQFDNIVKA